MATMVTPSQALLALHSSKGALSDSFKEPPLQRAPRHWVTTIIYLSVRYQSSIYMTQN